MNYKRIVWTVALMAALSCGSADAQNVLGRLAEKAKNAAENAVGNKIENAVNNVVDKAGKKGKGKVEETVSEPVANTSEPAAAADTWVCPECGKAGNTGDFCSDCGAKKQGTGTAAAPAQQASPAPAPQKNVEVEYAKSDFVPGDQIFFEDTMEGEQLGEFPSKWDLLEGEAENAKVNGKTCISLIAEKSTRIEPLMKNQKSYLPDVFTLEFDFYRGKTDSSMGYGLTFINDNDAGYAFEFDLSGQHSTELGGHVGYYAPNNGDRRSAELAYSLEGDTWNHFALSFNKRALKIYINGKRVANIPNCQKPDRFNIWQYSWGGFDDSGSNAITNVRLAQGAVPLYDRLTTDGKIITYAITFETGKADLKPESMVEITRIATLMKENANLSFEVQGHCDATGSDKVNDPLSQKRAEAIVAALVEQGIAGARLTAVGKGSHVPIADNSSDEGRAKNRRVEFVKK